MGRDDDPARLEQVEGSRQQHRPGGSVGDEAEVPRVDAVTDGDVGHLLGDVRHRDAKCVSDPVVEAKRGGERLERLAGEIRIEPHLARRETLGIEDAHQQAGVGEGRLGAAAAVAGGARHRAGARGPDGDVAGR